MYKTTDEWSQLMSSFMRYQNKNWLLKYEMVSYAKCGKIVSNFFKRIFHFQKLLD